VRVFAALPLPEPAVEEISAILAPFRRSHPQLRWVSPSAYHLTLHFFGEVDGEALSALRHVFAEPRLKRTPIAAKLGPLGQFPGGGNPRVIWIGLREDQGQLRSYWELFESTISPLGWESDKRGFTPHVTLARNSGSPVSPGWDSDARLPEHGFSVSECVLFQSILGRGGAEYVPLERITFDGGAA
jgi:RNA 2',3'-cyclic 3'-phosphodiesterase